MTTADVPTKILVADDDRALLQTLIHILKNEGHEVVAIDRAERLLDEMESHRPDLLLLDIMMPKVNGLELLERIKRDPRWEHLPVLMISSMPAEEATARSLGLGADDFIAKPFRVKELLARVNARLHMRRALRSAQADAEAHAEEAKARTDEARVRAEMVDILHEITDSLKPDEIYHVLARRVARVLKLSKCSMVLAQAGDRVGLVVAAFENPSLRNLEIELRRYPEIRKALETGRPVLVKDVLTDPLYEEAREEWKQSGYDVTTRSAIALPFSLRKEQRGVFFLRTTDEDAPLEEEDVAFAGTVIAAAVNAIDRAYDLESAVTDRERFQEMARTDPLTGCYNRRALFERLEREIDRVKRYDRQLALLLVDLDNFKDVNDGRGHLAGDAVLRQVGNILRGDARSVDIVARFGGDEFVVVLPDTAAEGALISAERLRHRIGARDFAEAGESLYVTVSIGVACMPAEGVETGEEFITMADRAMYAAKDEGRNQVRG